MNIPVAPVPKPRMTKSDSWRKRPAVVKYWKFKDDLKAVVKGDLEPRFKITFYVPMSVSWSKRQKAAMNGQPHQMKPDIDNYLKAFMDALSSDDSYIYDVHARKFWSETGSIELEEF